MHILVHFGGIIILFFWFFAGIYPHYKMPCDYWPFESGHLDVNMPNGWSVSISLTQKFKNETTKLIMSSAALFKITSKARTTKLFSGKPLNFIKKVFITFFIPFLLYNPSSNNSKTKITSIKYSIKYILDLTTTIPGNALFVKITPLTLKIIMGFDLDSYLKSLLKHYKMISELGYYHLFHLQLFLPETNYFYQSYYFTLFFFYQLFCRSQKYTRIIDPSQTNFPKIFYKQRHTTPPFFQKNCLT